MTCFDTGFSVLLDIETWKNWVPIISLLVAICALGVAYWQVRVARLSAASAQAHSIYQNYLGLCIEYPELASGSYTAYGDSDMLYAKYTWFFSSMLFAFEQILEAKPKDQKWIATIRHQLTLHKTHLGKSSVAISDQWHESLRSIIDEVRQE